MKRPVAHSLNSTWFWIALPENCCEPLKFIMKYISIQFCERPGHGRPFHALVELLVSSVICRFQGLSYLHVPDCIRVFFYFVNSSHYSSYFDFCTKCNILDINLLWNMNFVDHLLFYIKLLNYLFCDMFGSVLECYELTHISWLSTPGNHAWLNRHCYPIGCVIKSTH